MNILDALDAAGIEYRPHSSKEGELWICCPFCEEEGTTPDTRFRLGINYVEGRGHCFNCGKSMAGDYLLDALKKKLDSGELELAAKVAKLKRQEAPAVKLPEDFALVGDRDDHWGRLADAYLKKRGVPSWQIKAKKIGYSVVGDFRYRIVIPVYENHELVGIVARAFVDGLEPKYKNSLGERTLYNIPEKVIYRGGRKAALSEGCFDALAIERAFWHDYNQSVDSMGVLGHSLTERQLKILSRYEHFILWPDPDEAGLRGFLKIGMQLQEFGTVEMVVPYLDSRDCDPADLEEREIIKHYQKRSEVYRPTLVERMRVLMAFQED